MLGVTNLVWDLSVVSGKRWAPTPPSHLSLQRFSDSASLLIVNREA